MIVSKLFVLLIYLLAGVVFTGLIGPVRTAIESEYDLTHSQFGLPFALLGITINVLMLFIAMPRLSRTSSVRLLIWSAVISIFGLLAVSRANSYIGYLTGWSFIFTAGKLTSAANTISRQLWASNAKRGVIILHAVNSLGKTLGPLVAGVALLIGWRLSFATAAALYAIFLICFLPLIRRLTLNIPPPPPSAISNSAFRSSAFWLCSLPFGLIAGGEAAFATLISAYFEKCRAMSPTMAAFLFSLHLLGLLSGRVAFAWLSDRLSNNAIIGYCLAAGLFIFPSILIDHLFINAVSLFLLGLMFSATWPVFYAQASLIAADHKAMLAYGAVLGTTIGVQSCIAISSTIADYHFTAALIIGPCVLWLFGLLYFSTRLSRTNQPLPGASQ